MDIQSSFIVIIKIRFLEFLEFEQAQDSKVVAFVDNKVLLAFKAQSLPLPLHL
jgi:hypothetical protein